MINKSEYTTIGVFSVGSVVHKQNKKCFKFPEGHLKSHEIKRVLLILSLHVQYKVLFVLHHSCI